MASWPATARNAHVLQQRDAGVARASRRAPRPAEEWAQHYHLYRRDGRTPLEKDEIPLFRALSGEVVRDAEMVIAPTEGNERRVLAYGEALLADDGEKLGAVVAMHDITERRRFEDEPTYQALHDSLTGLPNRSLLSDRLGHALRLAQRASRKVAVLFVDLDRFKTVNHNHGHKAGDRLLVALAERLTGMLRTSDTIGRLGSNTLARFGGDEFIVLCEQLNDERDAVVIADRIAAALATPFPEDGETLFVSASIGIALGGNEINTARCADPGCRRGDVPCQGARRSPLRDL